MTERLYYTDSYLTEFDARVVAIERIGDRPAARLDRTAFYPTSGGQPFDTGAIGAARVTDVVDRDDGVILHVFEGDLTEGAVVGRVDWDRRFEHMQQHTGQHVLSAAFDRCCHARTESFHLGSVASTIDLGREVSPAAIERAETEANRIVWEDRAVVARFVEAEEAAALPLRKEPARGGRLRLIDIEGFDLSACGGTHVARTGAIGIIAVSGWERFRGGTRVEFRCGVRALIGYRSLRDGAMASLRLLSVSAADLPAAIERLQADAKDLRRTVKDLTGRLSGYEADSLARRAQPAASAFAAVEALEGFDANGLKNIASAIVERPKHVAVLMTTVPPISIVVARASDVDLNSAVLLKQLTDTFGGRGGGRPELAQGGGLSGTAAAIVAFTRSVLGVAPA